MDSNGTQLSFISITENLVISSLSCCSSYSYRVSARTSAGEGRASQLFHFVTYGDDGMTCASFVHAVCYNRTLAVSQNSIPILGSVVRTSATAAVMEISDLSGRAVDVTYYTNVRDSFDEVQSSSTYCQDEIFC